MITFVDTNILLDVFLPDPDFGERSASLLETAFNDGSLITNEIVYAELVPQFKGRGLLDECLQKLGIRIISIDAEVSYLAGITWKKYRKTGGKRERILADFLIGAHAQIKADRLLSRHRGLYRRYFRNLKMAS